MLSVQKQGGLRSLVGWVKGRLIELFTFLGVFDIVTEFQVQMLATRLCTKYYYWTTTELDYAFIRIMEGKYGKLYQYKHEYKEKSCTTINPQDLMIALDSYEKELLLERGRVEDERRKEEERLNLLSLKNVLQNMKAVLSLANAMWMTMMNSHQNMASETFLRFSLSKMVTLLIKT